MKHRDWMVGHQQPETFTSASPLIPCSQGAVHHKVQGTVQHAQHALQGRSAKGGHVHGITGIPMMPTIHPPEEQLQKRRCEDRWSIASRSKVAKPLTKHVCHDNSCCLLQVLGWNGSRWVSSDMGSSLKIWFDVNSLVANMCPASSWYQIISPDPFGLLWIFLFGTFLRLPTETCWDAMVVTCCQVAGKGSTWQCTGASPSVCRRPGSDGKSRPTSFWSDWNSTGNENDWHTGW